MLSTDPRWGELGRVLIEYSTRTQAGEKVVINMGEVETLPLVRAVYACAIEAGAFPFVQFTSAYLERELLRKGNKLQLDWVPEMELTGTDWADVYVGLRGARNPYEFAGIDEGRITAHRRALGQVSMARNERTRWVLVRVPNEALAQEAGTSLTEMIDFFFAATVRDWPKEVERYRTIQRTFAAASDVRITGVDTDIRFSTRDRVYEIGDGRHNMPDGEIYTAPVDDSAQGSVYFEFPGIYGGRKVNGIRLEFQEGRVVRATSDSNEGLLRELLAMDEGSSRLGEFGVGINYGITRFSNDILYDEKIGGTIHLALGRAYRECGGVNDSALHWDLVKDLRTNGTIRLDGQIVFENGRWAIEW